MILLAPFIPFITEEIYQNLKTDEDKQSIHLNDYPKANENFIDKTIEEKINLARKITSMARSLRSLHNIKYACLLAQYTLSQKIKMNKIC